MIRIPKYAPRLQRHAAASVTIWRRATFTAGPVKSSVGAVHIVLPEAAFAPMGNPCAMEFVLRWNRIPITAGLVIAHAIMTTLAGMAIAKGVVIGPRRNVMALVST